MTDAMQANVVDPDPSGHSPDRVTDDRDDAPPALRRVVDHQTTITANRRWWDEQAEDYYAEHGEFLGDSDLVWGPEGWSEQDLGLLGELAGRDVLEIGCGAGQGARYAVAHGGRVIAADLSAGMLAQARRIDRGLSGVEPGQRDRAQAPTPAYLLCDATRLPLASASMDIVFTAFGVVPFVADSAGLMAEVARVLRPGGRFVFSTTHPFRWALPDDPEEAGLSVFASYFDRTPYVELAGSAADPRTTYVEHHRTMGDRVREIVAAGLVLRDLVEPQWPEWNTQTWGGWSPLRGDLIPGTAIFVAVKP